MLVDDDVLIFWFAFFQYVPKLTHTVMTEMEKILCNRPVARRELLNR